MPPTAVLLDRLPTVHDEYARDLSHAVATELSELREKRGVTIRQLVVDTGIAKSTLIQKLQGRSDLGVDELALISRALDEDPFQVMVRAQMRVGRR